MRENFVKETEGNEEHAGNDGVAGNERNKGDKRYLGKRREKIKKFRDFFENDASEHRTTDLFVVTELRKIEDHISQNNCGKADCELRKSMVAYARLIVNPLNYEIERIENSG